MPKFTAEITIRTQPFETTSKFAAQAGIAEWWRQFLTHNPNIGKVIEVVAYEVEDIDQ